MTDLDGFAFGIDAGLPAGYVRCDVGRRLLRGHTPGIAPDWFGPAVGTRGLQRFDWPAVRTAADPGVCYLAPELDGVILERVLRGVIMPALSRATLSERHAVASVTTTRPLVLIDLVRTLSTVHGLQVADIASPPPYDTTQERAAGWFLAVHPIVPDGLFYSSRFAPAVPCIALWDRARAALQWGGSTPLGHGGTELEAACNRLGIGLLP